MNQPEEFNLYTELKVIAHFFIEIYLLLIIVQYISEKIDNNTINYLKDAKIAAVVSIILYIAKLINLEAQLNISQGMHYTIAGAVMAKYNI